MAISAQSLVHGSCFLLTFLLDLRQDYRSWQIYNQDEILAIFSLTSIFKWIIFQHSFNESCCNLLYMQEPVTFPVFERYMVAGYSQCKMQVMSRGRASENRTFNLKCPTLIAGTKLLAPLFPDVDKSQATKQYLKSYPLSETLSMLLIQCQRLK